MSYDVVAGKRYDHDPDAELDYTVDWSDWLPEGDALSASTWTVPAGMTLLNATRTGTLAVIWLAFDSNAGEVGTVYRITNHIVTTGGRKDDRSFEVVIKEK